MTFKIQYKVFELLLNKHTARPLLQYPHYVSYKGEINYSQCVWDSVADVNFKCTIQ